MDKVFTFSDGALRIAKNKDPLDIQWSREFSGEPTSITISMDCSERYFVSFAIEEHVYSLPQLGNAIGIDVGINEENLAKRQRQLSKKVSEESIDFSDFDLYQHKFTKEEISSKITFKKLSTIFYENALVHLSS